MSTRPDSDLSRLAPGYRVTVEALLARMEADGRPGLVFEAFRSDERQRALYAQGRTAPGRIVTNASTGLVTVHRYGLATDIIHPTRYWGAPLSWWRALYTDAAALGLTVGGRWRSFPDPPHVQIGAWKGSPPPWARALAQADNLAAVWERLGVA